MEHLVNRIISFVKNVPELRSEGYTEEIYNYIMWSLLRHIDYSVIVEDDVRRSLGYYTMNNLYKELCRVSNVNVTLGYMCFGRPSLRLIEDKLGMGDLYLFYLSHLDMSEEFHYIALEFIDIVIKGSSTIGHREPTEKLVDSKVKNRVRTLLKRKITFRATTDKLVKGLKNSYSRVKELKTNL